MRILVAPDKFKGSISASDVAQVLGEELQLLLPTAEIHQIPVADGGDGALEVLDQAGFTRVFLLAPNAMGTVKEVSYGLSADSSTAFIELAAVCGIAELDPKHLDPWKASTKGLGVVMRHCIERGANHVTISIGGSASIDGGSGLLEGLGAYLYDSQNTLLAGNLQNLHRITSIDTSRIGRLFNEIKLTVLSDVDNPLVGVRGAAKVFGEQKGLHRDDIARVDEALTSWATCLKPDNLENLLNVPGIGAGGGVALPLHVLNSARIVSGTDFFFKLLHLEDQIKASDLIVTGEGSFDEQSSMGKIVGRIVDRSVAHHKAITVIAGISNVQDTEIEIIELSKLASSKQDSQNQPEKFLRIAAQEIALRYRNA